MQTAGQVDADEHRVRVLVAAAGHHRRRPPMGRSNTSPATSCATRPGSKVLGIQAGEYARVRRVHAPDNRLTVTRTTGEPVTYDPRRLQGVTLYREADRAFAVGDRVQFTAPYRERHVANRELGTLEQIDASGELRLRLDSGRPVTFSLDDHPHLDYGYAVTSHSSQGQTADRVLVHVDTERRRGSSSSIGAWRTWPCRAVGMTRRSTPTTRPSSGTRSAATSSHRSAMELGRVQEPSAQKLEPSAARRQEVQLTITR